MEDMNFVSSMNLIALGQLIILSLRGVENIPKLIT